MMGVAAWMVQQQGVGRKPMILYGIQVGVLLHCPSKRWDVQLGEDRRSCPHSLLQLALNLIWNPIFFKGQLTWAVADIAGTVLCSALEASAGRAGLLHCTSSAAYDRVASIMVAALLGVLTATIVEFQKVKPEAAYLLLPYLAWTSYAAALTVSWSTVLRLGGHCTSYRDANWQMEPGHTVELHYLQHC